jgi:hypothetical protein
LLFLISAGAILVALTLDFTPWGNSKVLNS